MKHFLGAALIAMSCMGCGGSDSDNSGKGDTPDTPDVPEKPVAVTFANGADISWVTEMEADGKKFYNAAGKETDCFQLMKEIGMNAIRLRVWVNPEKEYGNYSNTTDVVNKAKRAKAEGLAVMIDFHYSDMFADPSRQTLPKAWEGKDLAGLQKAVASHTKEVLNAVKAAGVTPQWVQVGNETRNGMMWPSGQLWTEKGDIPNGWKNFVSLTNAGYAAVKEVFPEAQVIIHIDNAWEDNDWWFQKFRAAGGQMDQIGLSHYPQTHETKSYTEMNSLALAHIRSLAAKYGVKVMVSEVGVKSGDEALAATVLKAFMTEVKKLDVCTGVFYWEPQVYGGWKPASYNKWGWGPYDMGAFTTDGRPAAAMEAFK